MDKHVAPSENSDLEFPHLDGKYLLFEVVVEIK